MGTHDPKAPVVQSHRHGDRNVWDPNRSDRAMGFFRPANDDDQGGGSSDDEDDVVADEVADGAADGVRDEAGESLPPPVGEAEPLD